LVKNLWGSEFRRGQYNKIGAGPGINFILRWVGWRRGIMPSTS